MKPFTAFLLLGTLGMVGCGKSAPKSVTMQNCPSLDVQINEANKKAIVMAESAPPSQEDTAKALHNSICALGVTMIDGQIQRLHDLKDLAIADGVFSGEIKKRYKELSIQFAESRKQAAKDCPSVPQ